MNLNKAGVEFIKSEEGLKLDAYLDSVGVPTIGYGHTNKVKIGDKITKRQADEFFENDRAEAENTVNKLVKVNLTQNQFNALVCFVYNLGEPHFRGSTLLKRLNEGNYKEAQNQFGRWVYAGGKVSKGLQGRRAREAKVFGS